MNRVGEPERTPPVLKPQRPRGEGEPDITITPEASRRLDAAARNALATLNTILRLQGKRPLKMREIDFVGPGRESPTDGPAD